MTPDIFFVSSHEPGADLNWERVRSIAPHARRISNQPGIRAAYVACAQASRTSHCIMVDGDNWLLDDFAFGLDFELEKRTVAVWRARNPVNGLVNGHGAIKLFPACVVRTIEHAGGIDIGTSLGAGNHRRLGVIASEHRFNTNAFDAWRTAFRECVKLSANLICIGNSDMAAARLDTWCADVATRPVPAYADDCVAGARAGRAYGRRHAGQTAALSRINDYAWLREMWASGP
jgi:hypothetical protein